MMTICDSCLEELEVTYYPETDMYHCEDCKDEELA